MVTGTWISRELGLTRKRTKKMRRHRLFVNLCLSMVWMSIAAETPHFIYGRLSVPGDVALMGVVAGLATWCVASHINFAFVSRLRRYIPLLSAALCASVLVPSNIATPFSAIYGISCGLFFASSLAEYLEYANADRYMLKIGLSAGIYTTAVYPFGLAYTLLVPCMPETALKLMVFGFLAALSLVVCALRMPAAKDTKEANESPPAEPPKYSRIAAATVASLAAFAFFNHLLNSGVLEQQGGTASAPYIFFVNVALRLPMGALMGHFADRGRWYWAVGFPLALMVGGCAISLFSDGIVSDFAMLGAFNCGGAAIVMFLHIFGMQTARWRQNNAFAACFGSFLHFALVAFFNINTLGITPEFFGSFLRRPLTFAVIIAGLPVFLLVMRFLADERLRIAALGFFGMQAKEDTATDDSTQPNAEPPPTFTVSRREYEVLMLLGSGKTTADVAAELFISEKTVRNHVSNMIIKTDAKTRANLLAMAFNGQIKQK